VIPRLLAAFFLAIVVLPATAQVALAECMSYPIRATDQLDVGYAFTATVTESSADVDPPKPENAPFAWHVELDIERVYRGRLADRLVFNGWQAGCHRLRGNALRTGDRIFVVSNVFRPDPARVDPFWTMDAEVVVWKASNNGWTFYGDVLEYGSDLEFYPPEARSATTTGDILALVADAPIPDTSTAAIQGRDSPWRLALLACTFVITLASVLRRLRFYRAGDIRGAEESRG
jgi:hypothetical protein